MPSTACKNEAVVIGLNSPALGTTPRATSGKIADTLTHNAGLTLATSHSLHAALPILFKPGDNCSDLGTAVYSSTGVAVSGNGTYHSADGTTKTGSNVTTQAGTYHWMRSEERRVGNEWSGRRWADQDNEISLN